ncbi:hypothetical protein KIN20_028039 [Parelaphostrongylus tenuis]|uniref:Uncharacterized protein n=1 Tax=Parelaphostrongylus tenuis TaxID=148309 RepID=A0AAD5WEH2_PARTN|nr:hypothetical protein KIN20_028039 [Parelaphostrongylus tenuis]
MASSLNIVLEACTAKVGHFGKLACKAVEIAQKEAETIDEKELVHGSGLRFRGKQTHYIGDQYGSCLEPISNGDSATSILVRQTANYEDSWFNELCMSSALSSSYVRPNNHQFTKEVGITELTCML